MNEDEYHATSVAAIARSWASNLKHTIDFTDMVGKSLTRLIPNLRTTDFLAGLMRTASDDQRRRWDAATTQAQQEVNRDFSTLNAHVLMAG